MKLCSSDNHYTTAPLSPLILDTIPKFVQIRKALIQSNLSIKLTLTI